MTQQVYYRIMDVYADVYGKKVGYLDGVGIFASRDFKKGEVVIRPTGDVVDHQTIYSIQIDWECHLDPDPPAKHLNHSCDPNLGIRTQANGIPEFIALRDIQKDEEVTFDYAMSEYTHYPRANPELDFDLTCYCDAKNCRGRMGYYSELSDELKAHYRGYISGYLVSGTSKGESG